jgi:hypothetical protein
LLLLFGFLQIASLCCIHEHVAHRGALVTHTGGCWGRRRRRRRTPRRWRRGPSWRRRGRAASPPPPQLTLLFVLFMINILFSQLQHLSGLDRI